MTIRLGFVTALCAMFFGVACGDDDGRADATADAARDTAVPDGDRPDGDVPDGDRPDGDRPDGDLPDGDVPDVAVDMGPIGCTDESPPSLGAESIAPGHRFDSPVFVTSAPGDASTLYVVERSGSVIVVQDGSVTGTFITVSGIVSGGEQGLLGMAFHPGYADNGRFFLYFTPSGPQRNAIAEFRRSAGDPLRADPAEVARLMDIRDSEGNHNGGMLAFGPDGFLYAGVGDEGGGGDRHGPIGNGLNKQTLFGSILRLDVDNAPSYAAAGNPFSGDEGLPQIWAYGLRNPWRFSFDRATGHMFIGDVGQNQYEEIDVIERDAPVGRNLGWRIYEGDHVFDPALLEARGDELVPDHHAPVLETNHDLGNCSITGGYVYRGSAIPSLRGWYMFSDFCLPDVVAFQYCDGEARAVTTLPGLRGLAGSVASFGEDADGEMYMVYVNEGEVLKIVSR